MQMHASWIAFVWEVCIRMRVCMCPPLRLLLTSGIMWHDMEPLWLVKQVLQLLYGSWLAGVALARMRVVETNLIRVKLALHKALIYVTSCLK